MRRAEHDFDRYRGADRRGALGICLRLVIATGLLCAIGCASAPAGRSDPLQRMLDHDAALSLREQARREAREEIGDTPAHREALWTLLLDKWSTLEERRYAVQLLERYDAAAFCKSLADRLMQAPDALALQVMLDRVVANDWKELTPNIMRSLARGSVTIADEDRPELAALRALHGEGKVSEAAWAVFVDHEEAHSFRQRTAAWHVMHIVEADRRAIRERLMSTKATHRFMADLQACWRELHVLPTNREGVLWMSMLRQTAGGDESLWRRAAKVIAQLSEEQKRGLALRHLPVVVAMSDGLWRIDVKGMRAKARYEVALREHHHKPTNPDRPKSPLRVTEDWHDKLCWADLATVVMLSDLLGDVRAREAFFDQADADMADKHGEHGGLILVNDGRLVVKAYPAKVKGNDMAYYAPPLMVVDLYQAIAHYHFHAQYHDNAQFAGPGLGDVRLADRLGASCLVLTFVAPNALNVDYYQPDGVIVDLGTIYRSKSR